MIDLSVVFLKYPEYLANQQQLNSLLSDLYPTEKRDRHIIMEIYKSEYWEKIKGGISIDERTIYYWSQMISQDTGISDALIIEGISAWVGGRDTQIAVDNWESRTRKKLSLEQGDLLYCTDGTTAVFQAFSSGEIYFLWKGKSYHRPISDIDKTLFLCPIYNEDEKDSLLCSTKLNATEAKKTTKERIEGILEKINKEKAEKTQRQNIQGTLAERYSKDCEESVTEDDAECLSLDDVDIVPAGAGKHLILDEWVPIAESRPTENMAFQLTLPDALAAALSTLTPREAKVLQLHFGLEDGRLRTLEEVGHEFNVEREVILQIEAKALRKLRHPTRSKYLRDYLYEK